MQVVVFINATFATNYELFWKLVVIVLMRETIKGAADILRFAYSKSEIVCKSVLAAEMFSLVDEYDAGYTIAQAISETVGREVGSTLYTDSC